jgi:predicted GIY-YIG superfamily endonuclease
MNADNSRTLIFYTTGGLVIALVTSAFAGGLYLALSLGFEVFSKGQLLALIFTLCSIATALSLLTWPTPIRIGSSCGIIYIMRRSDGILKFGKSRRLKKRLKAHRNDYKSKFDIAACWVVPNSFHYEQLALRMTQEFTHSEIGRKELRKMTKPELNRFILQFTSRVQRGLNQ